MFLIINADSSLFLLLGWSARKRLYPSIVILSSNESIDGSKNVLDRQIKSWFFDTDIGCNKETYWNYGLLNHLNSSDRRKSDAAF